MRDGKAGKSEGGGRGFQGKDTAEAKLRGPSWQRRCLARVAGGGESGSSSWRRDPLENGPVRMPHSLCFWPHSQCLLCDLHRGVSGYW